MLLVALRFTLNKKALLVYMLTGNLDQLDANANGEYPGAASLRLLPYYILACIYNIDHYRSFGVERRNLVVVVTVQVYLPVYLPVYLQLVYPLVYPPV